MALIEFMWIHVIINNAVDNIVTEFVIYFFNTCITFFHGITISDMQQYSDKKNIWRHAVLLLLYDHIGNSDVLYIMEDSRNVELIC